MTSPINLRSFIRSPLVVCMLLAAFVFTMGFFIRFGREAHNSKSWQYVLNDSDDLFYWSVAKGRTMTTRCDGNPYYYEEQGTRSIIPCTTSEIIGLLSKYTGIPFSWIIPAWQVLMPLFVWFGIVVCCWKLWKYPLGVSAAVTLILLLITLYSPWRQFLFRARGMDGSVPLFLWISLIFKGDPRNKKHCAVIIFVSALALWLQPFLAVFGFWITALEYVYSLLEKKGLGKVRLYLCALGSCLVSGVVYVGYAYFSKNTNLGLLDNRDIPPQALSCCLMTVLLFAVVAAIVLFFRMRLKRQVTPLDRLVVEWTLFGVLCYFFTVPFEATRHMPWHMCYFYLIMTFSLAGWGYEKICALKEAGLFSKFSNTFMAFLAVFLVFSLGTRENLFSAVSQHYYVYVVQYSFIVLFFLWLFARFDALGKVMMQKKVIGGVILCFAVVAYWKFPLNAPNRDFPFIGGYQWLKKNAEKNSVVLTASLKYRLHEYLFLKTGLKSYYYVHGGDSANPMRMHRKDFVTGLLLGLLDKMPEYSGWPLEKKLRAFKLDYILMPKPSPFFDSVITQLRGHLQMVYEDHQCWLWKVS